MGHGGEIYIFDMGNPVKIVDLARRMIYLSGQKNIDFTPMTHTSRFQYQLTRFRNSHKITYNLRMRYEELLNVKEFTCPTYHEKIMIAKVREYDYEEVKQEIQKLIDLSYTSDTMGIVASMKKIVPEFVSKNSEFEILDKASF